MGGEETPHAWRALIHHYYPATGVVTESIFDGAGAAPYRRKSSD